MSHPIQATFHLGFPWPTLDPFLFCVHHDDAYPEGNELMGPVAPLTGRNLGGDFVVKDGWRMYHGETVPGFPRHPHRGFETVTLARQGYIDHADSMGATARFGHGDAQWMTAGKGVVHAEMFPLVNRDRGNRTELFQIWLNLPARHKMVEPHFTMLWNEAIPQHRFSDAQGRVVEVVTVAGTLSGKTPPKPPPSSWASDPSSGVAIWTIRMAPGARWTLPAAAAGLNRTLFAFLGKDLTVAGQTVPAKLGMKLQSDVAVELVNGSEPSELLMLQGRPIGEPVEQHGPFVMNTRDELMKAYADYRSTGFGGWPWKRDDPVHSREKGRFAIHANGHTERPV